MPANLVEGDDAERRRRLRRQRRRRPGHRAARVRRRPSSSPPTAAAATRSGAAGTTGTIGPEPRRGPRRASRPSRSPSRSSIPEAQITPGFPAGVMPANYGETLTPEQLQQLVALPARPGRRRRRGRRQRPACGPGGSAGGRTSARPGPSRRGARSWSRPQARQSADRDEDQRRRSAPNSGRVSSVTATTTAPAATNIISTPEGVRLAAERVARALRHPAGESPAGRRARSCTPLAGEVERSRPARLRGGSSATAADARGSDGSGSRARGSRADREEDQSSRRACRRRRSARALQLSDARSRLVRSSRRSCADGTNKAGSVPRRTRSGSASSPRISVMADDVVQLVA